MDSLGHDHADGMRPWGSEARGAVAQFAVAVGESKIRAGQTASHQLGMKKFHQASQGIGSIVIFMTIILVIVL